MLYTGKDGNLYSRSGFYCGIEAHPEKDKEQLIDLLNEFAELINQHPERPLSRFPESNKVFVDPDNCIFVAEKLSDVCGFGGTIRVIGLLHPEVVTDRTFGRTHSLLMSKYFRKASLSVTEVRHIGASSYYASPEALAELRSASAKKALTTKKQ